MIRFSHGAATSVGRVRQVNEDRFLAVPPLFAVADGMGGYDGGEIVRRHLADHALVVHSDCIPRIQEVQASTYHTIRDLLEITRYAD